MPCTLSSRSAHTSPFQLYTLMFGVPACRDCTGHAAMLMSSGLTECPCRGLTACMFCNQRAQSQPGWNPVTATRAQLRQLGGTPWEEAFPVHVATLAALAADRPGDAYVQLIASVQPFIKVCPCRVTDLGSAMHIYTSLPACSPSSRCPLAGLLI